MIIAHNSTNNLAVADFCINKMEHEVTFTTSKPPYRDFEAIIRAVDRVFDSASVFAPCVRSDFKTNIIFICS